MRRLAVRTNADTPEDAKKARTKKKAQAAVDAFEKIAKKYEGTYAAKEATAQSEKLKARMQRMR